MKKINLVFVFLFCHYIMYSQNVNFNNGYTFGNKAAVFSNVAAVEDTFIVTGVFVDTLQYQYSMITKFNNFGTPINQYKNRRITDVYTTIRNTMSHYSNNDYIVLSAKGDSSIVFILNKDSVVRSIAVSKSFNQKNYISNYLIKTTDNGFLLGGEVLTPNTANYKTFLIKLDSLGNLIWRKEYGNNINCNMIRSLSLDNDGGYLIGGGVGNLYTYNNVNEMPICQATIFKTDTAGTVLWQWQDTAHYCSMQAFGLQPTDDNGYIYTNWQATSIDTFGDYGGKYYITKMDLNRNLVFKKVFGIERGYDVGQLLYTLKKDAFNNYIAVGHRFEGLTIDTIDTALDYGYIVKFNSSGDLLWERKYVNSASIAVAGGIYGFTTNKLYDFDFKADGGIIACGDVFDFTLPSQQQKAWLLSLDSYGCLSAGCHLFDAVTETEKKEGVFKAYPNPANDVLYIQHLPGFEMQHCELQMTEITGKIVMQQKLINQEVTYIYSTETLNNGIYFLSLKTESGLVQTEKIIVNR